MGLPLIANAGVGDVDSIIKDTKSGILIEDFSNENYKNAIEQIYNLLNVPTKQLQTAARKYYSLEEGVKRYNSIYEKISGGTSRSEES